MSVDTAPGTATRTAVPVIASGPEAAWKYHHAGNYLLNDTPPHGHGQL
jgi:hypothetical protein